MLREYNFHYADEDALQRGIEEALGAAGAPFTRELRLDYSSRIDFMVHAAAEIGIEVKIAQSAPEVERQVRRYMKNDGVEGLVLVTTRRRHRTLEDSDIEFDKPFQVVWLGKSGL